MRCYRRLLNISYKNHVTDEEVCRKGRVAVGEYDELLTFSWFSKDNPVEHSERTKKKRQTEEEVGRQYHRVVRNVICQLH